MGIDLMSVDRSSLQALGGKPRPANDSEVSAYMRWQRERRGLPDMQGMELEWRTYPGSRGQRLCIGATFGKKVQERRQITPPRWEGETYFPGEYQPELWENGAYSLIMPGHDAHKQAVTFESLDDAGNVERAQTLPMEPKKGGVIWSRDDVRKAHGPVEKVRKVRAGKAPIPVEAVPIPVHAEVVAVDPVEICPQEAAESDCAACAVVEVPEAPEALCEAVSAPDEPVTLADELPADPVAALVARVEAIEAQLAASLSVETGHTPIPAVQDGPPVDRRNMGQHEKARAFGYLDGRAGRERDGLIHDDAAWSQAYAEGFAEGALAREGGSPTVAKRSAAHERAIRRAWAERRARRLAMAIAADHMGMREHLQAVARSAETCAKSAEVREARAIAELAEAKRAIESQREVTAAFETAWRTEQGKRRRALLNLREMRGRSAHYYANWKEEARRCGEADHAATFERQRAAVLGAQLAKAQEDLAGTYSEAELQAAVAVERERAANLRADLEAARAEGEGKADGAGVAAAQAAAQMARAIAAEEVVAAVRADLDKERAALAAVTARNARLLQSVADLTERVERAEAAIAA